MAVIGAGAGSNKETFSLLVAAKLAEAGIASLGVNSVARGFGPLSTNTVTLTGGAQLTFFSGGRGSDRNGDHLIGSAEGADATGLNALLASRDTATQTILEHVQLAKAIEAAVDVDGDGVLRSQPLAGSSPRAVLINIAKGDQTVPNPAARRVIRAGALEDTTLFYRHQFMTLITNTTSAPLSAQVLHQAAQFLATEGALVTLNFAP